jgi:hypothetical protein
LELEHELHFTTLAQQLRISLRPGDRLTRQEALEQAERIRFGGLALDVLGVEPSESEAWVAVEYGEFGDPEISHGAAAVVVVRS